VLTKHKQLVATFLETHYVEFFEHYDKLLHSENYVTKRQSVKFFIFVVKFFFFIICLFFVSSNCWENCCWTEQISTL
jgi:hypothetical protein